MSINKPQLLSVDIGDTHLQYLFYDGQGPAIILLHATGFLPWLWHPIARDLSGPFKIIAPYFCDHRETDPEKGGLDWMRLAEDLAILCEKLQLERPFLVGHSMGATVVTMANAAFGLMARKMILIEPIFFPQHYYQAQLRVQDHPLAAKSLKRRNFWQDAAEAAAYLKSKGLFKAWDDEMLALYIRHGMMESMSGGLELTCPPLKEASLFMGGMHHDPWPLLSAVRCPVLVLEGEGSGNKDFIDLKKAASCLAEGAYLLVAGADHLIPMEKPVQLVDIIRRYFAEKALDASDFPEEMDV